MAPPLGRCGACSMQFTSGLYAYNCVVCKRNFHPECLQFTSNYAKDGILFSVLRDANCVICKTCRETAAAEKTTDAKRPRDGTAAAADEEQITKLTKQLKRLDEDKRILEARLLTQGNVSNQAAIDKITSYEKENTELKERHARMLAEFNKQLGQLNEENNRLVADNTLASEKYSSLRRQHKKAMEQSTAQPRTPSDKAEQPIIITTANMNELLVAPLKQLMKEIRDEVRASRTQSVAPPPPPPIMNRRTTQFAPTFAEIARSQPPPSNTIRRRSASQRRSVSRRRTVSANRQVNPTPNEARNQRSKRISNAQPLKKAIPGRSMATVLAIQPVQLQNRFTVLMDELPPIPIVLNDEGEEIADTRPNPRMIFAEIQADANLATIADIAMIEKRSELSLYVETTTEEGATLLKSEIRRKYPAANIKEPVIRQPQIRITGCPIAEYTAESIKKQNPWLIGPISIHRTYDAGVGYKAYRNIIVTLTLEDQVAAIDAGRMIIGFTSCRVHEYVDVMQCRKCWRYGHFQHACKFAEVCRICGSGRHTERVCNAPRDACINCTRHNKTISSKVSTNHRVTDDRCPVRVSRNQYIMDYLLTRQPRRGGRTQEQFLAETNNMSTN